MTPLQLLRKELNEYKHSLEKSTQSFNVGLIDERLHLTHKTNLLPKIKEYKTAIYALEVFYKNKQS